MLPRTTLFAASARDLVHENFRINPNSPCAGSGRDHATANWVAHGLSACFYIIRFPNHFRRPVGQCIDRVFVRGFPCPCSGAEGPRPPTMCPRNYKPIRCHSIISGWKPVHAGGRICMHMQTKSYISLPAAECYSRGPKAP